MHYWGDEWFEEHGSKLDESISWVTRVIRKYGRIGTHGKEKYGCYRDHVYFWDGGIHTLIWPGYVRIVNRFLYWKVDPVVRFLTKWTGLYFLGLKYQAMVYNYTIQTVCKKYPEITDEMIRDIDAPHLIKPGIFGKVDGMTIHNKYWTEM